MARPEKKERNKEIYEKYKSGLSYRDIVRFYNIDGSAVWRIVKRLEKLPVDNSVDETN